jgi:hypothetical protein
LSVSTPDSLRKKGVETKIAVRREENKITDPDRIFTQFPARDPTTPFPKESLMALAPEAMTFFAK